MTDIAIRAVGKDGKTSGEDGDDWMSVRESAGFEDSVRVIVTVDPGAGEGGGVETIRLVTVSGGLLTRLDGDRSGETELVSRGREGKEMLVGGIDELWLMVIELGVSEGGSVEGGKGVEEGKDVRGGLERVVVVGKDVGVVLKERNGGEEDSSKLVSVMEEDGGTVELELRG